MRTTRLVTVLAAVMFSLNPAVATGQDTSTANLLRRIEVLERANADLQQRVAELEVRIKGAPSQSVSVPISRNWRDLANWRQLRRGMRPEQVRQLLGEPTHIEGGYLGRWSWPDGSVGFVDDKVDNWREPGESR